MSAVPLDIFPLSNQPPGLLDVGYVPPDFFTSPRRVDANQYPYQTFTSPSFQSPHTHQSTTLPDIMAVLMSNTETLSELAGQIASLAKRIDQVAVANDQRLSAIETATAQLAIAITKLQSNDRSANPQLDDVNARIDALDARLSRQLEEVRYGPTRAIVAKLMNEVAAANG